MVLSTRMASYQDGAHMLLYLSVSDHTNNEGTSARTATARSLLAMGLTAPTTINDLAVTEPGYSKSNASSGFCWTHYYQ